MKHLFVPHMGALVISVVVIFLFLPVIAYEAPNPNNVQCITAPCPGSVNGSLVEYWEYEGRVWGINWGIFVIGLAFVYVLAVVMTSLHASWKKK